MNTGGPNSTGTAAEVPETEPLKRALDRTALTDGLVGIVFSATGPVAVILAVGASAGLDARQLASWVSAVFVFNGILTIAISWVLRQPLVFFWTIPGAVVVGGAMATGTSWPQVVGGFLMSAALLLVLGATGRIDRLMKAVPMPVVMAMVAGVFLSFGTGVVEALVSDPLVAGPMIGVFVLVSAIAWLRTRVPPVLVALVLGALVVFFARDGVLDAEIVSGRWFVDPVWTVPVFDLQTFVSLTIPLVVTVVVVQNGQGMAVLTGHGHRPHMNLVTLACGVFTAFSAPFGGAPTCLAGPTNAIVTTHGRPSRHYAAAVVVGVTAILFGLLAPGMVRIIVTMPEAYVATIGGLAMLASLQGAFVQAFVGKYTTGALVCFLVTITDLTFLSIGAAFWGIVIGVLVSVLLDPESVRAGFRPTRTTVLQEETS
ncbi:benzoate/H(+) symporter BenE family transporter [Brevibacterium litoralis]|uniref:benzoate/H(+) symporter BenE family transporter n=1 Tax=Brevibacterium litoralis TaxID=3138935 RepID=UPI0032EABE2C